jgi:hypothetical protein
VAVDRQKLESFGARLGVQAGSLDQRIGFRLAVPGAYRKFTAVALSPEGHPEYFAKLPAHDGGVDRILSEAEALHELEGLKSLQGSIPRFGGLSTWHDRPMLMLGSGPGNCGRRRIGRVELEFLTRLHRETADEYRFNGSPAAVRWRNAVGALAASRRGRELASTFAPAIERISEGFGSVPIPMSLAHGDFTRWNTRRVRQRLFVFDWETTIAGSLPGHDAFHYNVIQRAVRGQQVSRPRIPADWLETIWPGSLSFWDTLWMGYLVEVGLHYALARVERPADGEDSVLNSILDGIDESLAGESPVRIASQ